MRHQDLQIIMVGNFNGWNDTCLSRFELIDEVNPVRSSSLISNGSVSRYQNHCSELKKEDMQHCSVWYPGLSEISISSF